jgi:hypothetical protein
MEDMGESEGKKEKEGILHSLADSHAPHAFQFQSAPSPSPSPSTLVGLGVAWGSRMRNQVAMDGSQLLGGGWP